MRVFGTVDTFVEVDERSLKLGRLVANAGLLSAVLRHARFDAFHLFCPTTAAKARVRQAVEAALPDPASRARVEVLHHLELPTRLRAVAYGAFHVGGWSRYLPRLAYLRGRDGGPPFPLTGVIHSLDSPDVPARVRQLLEAPLGPCDSVVCTSGPGREAFRRHLELLAARPRAGTAGGGFRGRLDVIPLGVDDPHFAARDRHRCRAALGLPHDGVHLLWVGRISAQSKADLAPLLYVLRALLRRGEGERDLHLMLVGACDAGNRRALESLAGELSLGGRVHLRHDVDDAAKLAHYGAADVFVSPVDSHQETFGIAVAEAMAAGLPVVASDLDGYRDLVEDGVTGLRVPTLWARPPARVTALRGILEPAVAQLATSQAVAVEPAGLYARLALLADDAGLRRSLGEAGMRRARERFHWPAVVARYDALWAELHAEAARAPPPAADPDVVDLFDGFSHYPTACLGPGARLGLGPLGAAVLAGELPMPAAYGDVAPLLDGAQVTRVMGLLRSAPRSLAELQAGAGACPADEVGWLALWMLKYGVAERV
jgi:glycosyltransferase involved in cell wall biosynthesis